MSCNIKQKYSKKNCCLDTTQKYSKRNICDTEPCCNANRRRRSTGAPIAQGGLLTDDGQGLLNNDNVQIIID